MKMTWSLILNVIFLLLLGAGTVLWLGCSTTYPRHTEPNQAYQQALADTAVSALPSTEESAALERLMDLFREFTAENLAAIDNASYRKRNLSNASLHSVDNAMKRLGFEAENAAVTSAAVNDLGVNGRLQPSATANAQRRGSAIKAMEVQGAAFSEPAAAATAEKPKSSACAIL